MKTPGVTFFGNIPPELSDRLVLERHACPVCSREFTLEDFRAGRVVVLAARTVTAGVAILAVKRALNPQEMGCS